MTCPYKVRGSREVYRNPWITVREDQVTKPSGADGVFGIVAVKDGSTVLAVDGDGFAYLVREYKYAAEQVTLEAISGGIEPGEEPIEAAKRELKEETGLTAACWIEAGYVDPYTSVVKGRNFLFIATELSYGESAPDDGEQIEVVRMPLAEAFGKAMNSEIAHAASAAVVLKAWSILGKDGDRNR